MSLDEVSPVGPEHRSGFVTLVGRPNVGKSSLVNRMLGTKVTIMSNRPNTTRTRVRGILNRPDAQVVIVDTPGIHRPRTALGERMNDSATDAMADVDLTILVVDATAPIGVGDRYVADQLGEQPIVAVNKVDAASKKQVLDQLARAASDLELVDAEFFPVSARTGAGVDDLVEHLIARLPLGPAYYPAGVVSDVPEAFFLAELVREQLLRMAKFELSHSIACRVVEWDWPYVRCEILVERESQKPIVVGKGGSVLKAVGKSARAQMPDGMYLDLHVKVEKDWQRRPDMIERLGY